MVFVDAILWIALILIFGTLITLGVILLFVFKKYDKIIHIKQIVNGNIIYHTRKARLKEQDSVRFWLALRKVNARKFFSVPPTDVIYIDEKGKEHADSYIDGEGTFRWYSDPNANVVFSKESLKSLKPMNSSERAIYVHELKKAARRKGLDWFSIVPSALNVFLVIFLIMGSIIFWDQQSELLDDRAQADASIARKNAETTQLLIDTFHNERTIVESGNLTGGGQAPN